MEYLESEDAYLIIDGSDRLVSRHEPISNTLQEIEYKILKEHFSKW